jgi:hypothetical protein
MLAEIAHRWSSAQWIWTALLAFFIALAVYDNLDWWPVLIPSAILTWYGAMRSTTGRRRGQE